MWCSSVRDANFLTRVLSIAPCVHANISCLRSWPIRSARSIRPIKTPEQSSRLFDQRLFKEQPRDTSNPTRTFFAPINRRLWQSYLPVLEAAFNWGELSRHHQGRTMVMLLCFAVIPQIKKGSRTQRYKTLIYFSTQA